ncbi:MAG: hypothetical protein EZS28_020240 [Streblomastix strix]|uniref:Uncharacterized protein n=1 Tax=Streblomastix strix TaxID=222440 RepID=A0A5J4VNY8_9EUKA|nr:MAG: hypothetical protein EZS28_020240 [Streblomastix strix]
MASLTEQELQQILDQEEINARKEFEAEKSKQGSGGAGGQGQNEITSKTVWQAAVPSQYDSKNNKACRPIIFRGGGDVNATLVGYLNRDIKKINSKRFNELEQDLDDNEVTPDNVVIFDMKKNAIYSVDGYTTAIGFGDPEHKHKRNWMKKYYSYVNDLVRAALAAKLKVSGIKGALT